MRNAGKIPALATERSMFSPLFKIMVAPHVILKGYLAEKIINHVKSSAFYKRHLVL